MLNKQRTLKIIGILKEEYPDAMCSLTYDREHELLFSVRLAAQCTDARVNIVAEELYERYKTLEDFADADIDELERIVKPCGFYKMKARDIKNCASMLLREYGGRLPDNMEELLRLPGVGRKSANLILGDVFNKPAVVADTHCIRLSNRLGFCDSKDPVKVEFSLREQIPPAEQSNFCHRLVHHGRAVCMARKPNCAVCGVRELCDYALKGNTNA